MLTDSNATLHKQHTFRHEKLVKQSHSPAGHQMHSGMAEEDAHELLACTVEQRQLSEEPDTSLDLVPTMPLAARRSLSHLEIDSGCRDLSRENNGVSEASQSNPVIAGEEESSHSIVEIAADNMKVEICSQLKEVQVQPEMICRVRQINRILDKDAYDPQFISFGFYHCDNEAFWLANKYKWSVFEQILNTYEDKDKALKMYLKEMDGVKQEVKDYYEGNIPIDTPNGIKMLLLDGCFILGILRSLPYGPYQEYEFSLLTLWNHSSIRHDLFLMENQLPFTVLKRIYDLAVKKTDVSEPHPLIGQVDETINDLLGPYPLRTNGQQFHHLLHCCHMKFKPAMTNSSFSKHEQKWHGATDLYKAGIKFKPKQSSDPSTEFSLLDVQLVSRRTLMIPTLIIEDNTISIFRNLIAFEQLCSNEDYFMAYVFFMGELMRTPEDVTLLVKEGVVKNYIGADTEISAFFNNLIKGVIFDVDGQHFLSSTFNELNSYYSSVGNKYLADLKQNYCGSPWLAISMVAAVVLLICTLVQTVFAVIK